MKQEGASLHNLFVGDEILFVGRPVPLDFIDIHILPGEVAGLRSRLHHAQRVGGTGEGMSREGGPDERVHILRQVALVILGRIAALLRAGQRQQKGGEKEYIFFILTY